MAKQYAVSPINDDGSHDADTLRSRSRAAAEREARKVARSGRFVAATVVECSIDADGDMICREAVAAVGDARALDAAGYADLPRLADDARKVHKVEKVDGGWSCAIEYRVETINADGDIMTHDMHDALDDALAAAVRAVAALAGEAVAVVVERATYSVPTRAEARLLAADPNNEPSDLTIDYETVAHFGDAAALRAGEWVAADCTCPTCTRPTPPTTPTPTDDAAQTARSAAVSEAAERVARARAAVDAACDDDAALDAALVRLAEVEALHAALVRLAEREAAEVETPRALWLAEADDLDRLPSLGSWLARDWSERARCIVVVPTRNWRDGAASLVVRGADRSGPFMIGEEAVEVVEVRDECGRTTRLGSALHLACVAAAEARDAQGRAAAIVVVSDGQVRDLGRDADAAVRAYAQSIASFTYDRSASGISWAFDPHPARRFWAALGATA